MFFLNLFNQLFQQPFIRFIVITKLNLTIFVISQLFQVTLSNFLQFLFITLAIPLSFFAFKALSFHSHQARFYRGLSTFGKTNDYSQNKNEFQGTQSGKTSICSDFEEEKKFQAEMNEVAQQIMAMESSIFDI